jgi:diaminopropionate ammonia-lyase
MPKIEVMNTITSAWFAQPAARDWVAPASRRGHARSFHAGLPGYAPTPLVDLPALAAELGVAQVLVKDESARLGLPAFKVLGASWACAQVVAGRTGAELELAAVNLADLRQAAQGSSLRLVTATDGNHGRAVARMARLLGVTAAVFGPAIMTATARQAIVAEGAHFEEVDGNYDDAVRAALAYTQDGAGRQLVQDMSWPGYEQVPAWIVEGYETLAGEIDDALAIGPDLVAMPVGVGSLAQAVVTHYRRPGASRPALLATEPDTAACLLASMLAGEPVTIPTGATIMAGLNCGTLSGAAWPVLRAGCDAAVAVGDADAATAVDDLARLGISSGPSGAATLAGVRAALTGPGAGARREALRVDASSVVVLLSTEGRPAPGPLTDQP